MLRRATEQKLLTGWQGPHTDQRSYTISPRDGWAAERSLEDTIGYVTILEAAGYEPLIRESEPVERRCVYCGETGHDELGCRS
jgi:hypothetical protein